MVVFSSVHGLLALGSIPLHIEPHRLRDRLHEGPAILYRLLYFLIQTYTTQIIPATSQVARNEAKGIDYTH